MDWKSGARYLLGAIILVGLLYIADITGSISVLRDLDPALYMLAILIFMLGIGIGGVRWYVFNRAIEESISIPHSTRVYCVNYTLSTVLFGNIAELGRYKIQERYSPVESTYQVTGAVIVEKLFDFGALILIIVGSTSLLYLPKHSLAFSPLLISAKRRLSQVTDEGAAVVRRIMDDENTLIAIASLSAIIWTLEAISFYLIGLSLQASISPLEAAITTSAMTIASTLPVTPSGVGTTETAGYGLLMLFGLASGPALAIIAAQRLLSTFISSLPGAIIYYQDFL